MLFESITIAWVVSVLIGVIVGLVILMVCGCFFKAKLDRDERQRQEEQGRAGTTSAAPARASARSSRVRTGYTRKPQAAAEQEVRCLDVARSQDSFASRMSPVKASAPSARAIARQFHTPLCT